MRAILFFILLSSLLCLQAQSNRIILDEDFSDWANVPLIGNDPSGDQGSGLVDFGRLWVANDDDFLFLRIEVGAEINLQNDNEVTLYLDTDNDNNTGLAIDGIGAELVYNLGDRSGTVYLNTGSLGISHPDIDLVSSPTVTSTQFEIALSRKLNFQAQELFAGDDIRILLRDDRSNADKIPDATGGLSYTFQSFAPDPLPPYSIPKQSDTHVRVLSYNVLNDDLFDPNKQGNYARILTAIAPDIIGFQEIYNNSSAQTRTKVNSWLPAQWYHAKVAPDIIAISKYPIISSHVIAPGGNGAFLIDMGLMQLLFIVAHPPCCNNNSDRQEEMDGIMAFIRDAKNGLGPVNLPPNSPIIVAGDMNLVGFSQQQHTLLTGDIVNQNLYGPDFDPDWDASTLEDAKPLATNLPLTMTWYRESSSFSPGRLDYIVYSGSVMSVENTYSLFTPALSTSELATYNLQANDATIASDHLPLVADFDFGGATSIETDGQSLQLHISPNPLQRQATISYSLAVSSSVQINIFNAAGKKVFSQHIEKSGQGDYQLALNAQSFAAGIYYCQLLSDFGTQTAKFRVD